MLALGWEAYLRQHKRRQSVLRRERGKKLSEKPLRRKRKKRRKIAQISQAREGIEMCEGVKGKVQERMRKRVNKDERVICLITSSPP